MGTNEELVVEYQNALWETEDKLDWLRERGLEDEFIKRYYLGYVTNGYFADSICIPVLDGRADIKTLRYRRLSGYPKYDQSKHERAHLFNISSVRHRTVHITEGEFDAIVLEQIGRRSVGVPGINNFREQWRWLFIGNDVRIVFDSDKPGTEAEKNTKRAVFQVKKWLDPIAENVQVVTLPLEHDVSSFFVENPEGLKELMAQYDE